LFAKAFIFTTTRCGWDKVAENFDFSLFDANLEVCAGSTRLVTKVIPGYSSEAGYRVDAVDRVNATGLERSKVLSDRSMFQLDNMRLVVAIYGYAFNNLMFGLNGMN
jgi:hypothetical protein